MRRVRQQCRRCNGTGRVKRSWFDYEFGMSGEEHEVCSQCRGVGSYTLDVADDVRCVCGRRFSDMVALAAHRKEAHS